MHRAEHEKLVVYQRSLSLLSFLEDVARQLVRTRPDLADQIRRASTSVVLNLAEGGDEFSLAEKARFYRMARRSAAECVAALDVIERVTDIRPAPSLRSDLITILASLTTLVKRLEDRRRARHP